MQTLAIRNFIDYRFLPLMPRAYYALRAIRFLFFLSLSPARPAITSPPSSVRYSVTLMSEARELTQYAADFTNPDNEKRVQCERESCMIKSFPPGTRMEFMHSNDPTQPGRKVCGACYSYYMQKQTTRRRGMSNRCLMNPCFLIGFLICGRTFRERTTSRT